jgi:hypothetical protein
MLQANVDRRRVCVSLATIVIAACDQPRQRLIENDLKDAWRSALPKVVTSGDGTLLATIQPSADARSSELLTLRDRSIKHQLTAPNGGSLISPALSVDGRTIAAIELHPLSPLFSIILFRDGAYVRSIFTSTDGILDLALDETSRRLAFTRYIGSLQIDLFEIDIATGAISRFGPPGIGYLTVYDLSYQDDDTLTFIGVQGNEKNFHFRPNVHASTGAALGSHQPFVQRRGEQPLAFVPPRVGRLETNIDQMCAGYFGNRKDFFFVEDSLETVGVDGSFDYEAFTLDEHGERKQVTDLRAASMYVSFASHARTLAVSHVGAKLDHAFYLTVVSLDTGRIVTTLIVQLFQG